MGVAEVLYFAGLSVLVRLLPGKRLRIGGLLLISVLVLYWFQPLSLIRYLDFWLPTFTLILILLCWVFTVPGDRKHEKDNWITAIILAGLVLLIAGSRYLSPVGVVTASRPPPTLPVAMVLLLSGAAWFFFWLKKSTPPVLLTSTLVFLLLLFLIIKSPPVAELVGGWMKAAGGQSGPLTARFDIRWFGYSYIAFRLIHTIRDRQNQRLPYASLAEYIVYVIFFPALAAGPIDRIDKFLTGLREPGKITPDNFAVGGKRIVFGMAKKFVVADSLALFALNPVNASQVQSSGWAWAMLYAYALVIYFDFSGYTDIAIGLGQVMGIKLPENFNRPYLKPNLTLFWNSWHISLTQWFRTYYFNPLTRKLARLSKPIPPAAIIFVTQISTMVLIGLWHGVTLNYVIWGLWHGLGLFIHSRWASWAGPRTAWMEDHRGLALPARVLGVVLTFHFVALGWMWFVLPDPLATARFGSLLFGFE